MISGDSEIGPTEDEPVRAVDVLEPFAAVYRFSVRDDAGLLTPAPSSADSASRRAEPGGLKMEHSRCASES